MAQYNRKPHCGKGHLYTAENTYTSRIGKRYCLACKAEYRKAAGPQIRASKKANPRVRKTAEQRFAEKYTVNAKTGCWEWIGVIQQNRYGKFAADGEVMAHRWSYKHYRLPIPKGLEIDHLCRVRHCVNPWHMELVTHAENMQRSDCSGNGGLFNRDKTHCKHGHEFTPENTRITNDKGWRECIACRRLSSRKHKERVRLEQQNPLTGWNG